MPKKMYIFGTSQHAKLIAHYFEQENTSLLAGFVIDDIYHSETLFEGLPVQPYSVFVQGINPEEVCVFSAVGYRSMRARQAIFERLNSTGFVLPTYVHPTAFVDPTAKIGKNCILMPGVVVERNVVLGDNITVWSNVTICHDTSIESHCFIAANSVIGGNCKIASGCFLGFSSTVLQNTTLEEETLLGAMSLLQSCGDSHGKYLGIPAKRVAEHKSSGICIFD